MRGEESGKEAKGREKGEGGKQHEMKLDERQQRSAETRTRGEIRR